MEEFVKAVFEFLSRHWMGLAFMLYLIYNKYTNSGPFPEHYDNRVEKVTSVEQFDQILKENSRVVVDFFATWCPPCRAASVPFGQLSCEVENWKFCKVNTDECRALTTREGVSSLPSFKFYVEGKEAPGTMQTGFATERVKAAMEKLTKDK